MKVIMLWWCARLLLVTNCHLSYWHLMRVSGHFLIGRHAYACSICVDIFFFLLPFLFLLLVSCKFFTKQLCVLSFYFYVRFSHHYFDYNLFCFGSIFFKSSLNIILIGDWAMSFFLVFLL